MKKYFYFIITIFICLSVLPSVTFSSTQAELEAELNSLLERLNQAQDLLSQQTTVTGNTAVVPCVYTYNDWEPCVSSGIQTREYSETPINCQRVIEPVVQQKCFYVKPIITVPVPISTGTTKIEATDIKPVDTKDSATKDTTIITPTTGVETNTGTDIIKNTEGVKNIEGATTVVNVEPCVYGYSAWSDCVSGVKTRMILSESPSGCRENNPVLYQKCDSSTIIPQPTISVNVLAPAPQSVLMPGVVSPSNFNDRTNEDWQKYYFNSETCLNENTCGGLADPDKDGLSNNEEYRFGTNPKSSDSDRDGYVDANEIQDGRNPLLSGSETKSDTIIFESPKDSGEVKKELYQVTNVEMVKTEEGTSALKISGKALPNIYITVFIYSDPIVLTIKTDSNGDWSYTLDKPLEEGNHEVYVAVADNTGKVTAKSEPILFVQTAEATTIYIPSLTGGEKKEKEISPTKAWFEGNYLIFIAIGLVGISVSLLAIGLIKMKKAE